MVRADDCSLNSTNDSEKSTEHETQNSLCCIKHFVCHADKTPLVRNQFYNRYNMINRSNTFKIVTNGIILTKKITKKYILNHSLLINGTYI